MFIYSFYLLIEILMGKGVLYTHSCCTMCLLCICMHLCMCMYTAEGCVYMYTQRPGSNVGSCSSFAVHLVSCRASLCDLDQGGSLRDSPVFTSPALGSQVFTTRLHHSSILIIYSDQGFHFSYSSQFVLVLQPPSSIHNYLFHFPCLRICNVMPRSTCELQMTTSEPFLMQLYQVSLLQALVYIFL